MHDNLIFSRIWLGSFLILSCMIWGCASKYKQQDFIAPLDNVNKPYVIDVRTKNEYSKGHIPGAQNINVFLLIFRMAEVEADKDDPILVYCAHGPRAGMAGFFLRVAGFKKVYHLEGDWRAWKNAGLPVEVS